MLNELREAGLPMQNFSITLGERVLDLLHLNFPIVLKAGQVQRYLPDNEIVTKAEVI
jgi:hypothetical protein